MMYAMSFQTMYFPRGYLVISHTKITFEIETKTNIIVEETLITLIKKRYTKKSDKHHKDRLIEFYPPQK